MSLTVTLLLQLLLSHTNRGRAIAAALSQELARLILRCTARLRAIATAAARRRALRALCIWAWAPALRRFGMWRGNSNHSVGQLHGVSAGLRMRGLDVSLPWRLIPQLRSASSLVLLGMARLALAGLRAIAVAAGRQCVQCGRAGKLRLQAHWHARGGARLLHLTDLDARVLQGGVRIT